MSNKPTLKDIISANHRIKPYVTRTPLHRYLSRDRLLNAHIYVKHENHQRLGAFKMRGGINLVSQLNEQERASGVVAASSGNHGQSIAYAAGIFNTEATIVVPEQANPGIVESMENLGANVIFHGKVFDESHTYAESIAMDTNRRFIHSADEPHLISGVGTTTLEIIEDLPNVEVIIVPIGGGSGACGAGIAAKSINPDIKIIGVQSEHAKAAYLSWKHNKIMESPMGTIAEGLATSTGYELTKSILRDILDDFILVTDQELDQAIVLNLEKTHNLTEHAGASPLAAALKIKDQLHGKKVALIMSGGNLSIPQLKIALKQNT